MKQKFYSIKNILKQDSEYNIILGERSNGKSYAVKHYCIKTALDDETGNSKFIYLRRWDLEIKTMLIEQYFADANIFSLSGGKYDCIVYFQGKIWAATIDEKTQKPIKKIIIGYTMALTAEEHYKSGVYTDVKNLIYEEFITNRQYIPQEPLKLQQLISTIARRNRIKIWLVGNTITRLCPYFKEWELIHIPRQKQGTIETYEHKTDQYDEEGKPLSIKISVEYAENSGSNSLMFFGGGSNMITNGMWQTEEKPHLPKKFNCYYSMYLIVVEYSSFKFLCHFLTDKETGASLWYVEQKTTVIKEGTRVISDKTYFDELSTKGFIPLTKNEQLAFEYFKNGKIAFCDNLTGTDFDACLKNLLTM